MKETRKYIGVALAAACCACFAEDVTIENFESGTYGGWTAEGDAFGEAPSTGPIFGQQDTSGYEGRFFANSYFQGDDTTGAITSKEFEIQKDFINFLLGGGARDDVGIELAIDGQTVRKSRPIFSEEKLRFMSWDVKDLKGKTAKIRIFDSARGGWGHILADQIEMSDVYKSEIMPDYKAKFTADKKYILLPVDDSLGDIPFFVDVDGERVTEAQAIRLARGDKIDYYVPINIEKYKGREVAIRFDAHKGYKNLDKISTSDTFEINHDEKFRPSYHFTPFHGWMNDPNGMVWHDGEYHLFYQHNPYGSQWQNMSWGHAVSKDLVTWERLDPKICPDGLGMIFSGSAVVDKNNTAGFGKDAIVAIYTYAGGPQGQMQAIAHSTDKGRCFEKYEGNPVLADRTKGDFRDPKVMWYEPESKWVMSLATGQTISFYESKDLKSWNKLSEFGDGIGAHGGVWECPDLFSLKTSDGKTKWVLFVSINPGGPNGGSATQYFIGSFDGKTFKADKLRYPLWVDYGRDNYAGVTWSGAPGGRRLFIGWMNNWDYAGGTPTLHFKSATTLPRELSLDDGGKLLKSAPIKELERLRAGKMETEGGQNFVKLKDASGGAYEIVAVVRPGSADEFSLSLSNGNGESLDFVFDVKNKTLVADRTQSGRTDFAHNFPSVMKAPLDKSTSYEIRLFIDRGSSELFVNGGRTVMTNLVYPETPYDSIKFEGADGGPKVEALEIYKIAPAAIAK